MNKLTKIGVDRDADGVFPVYMDASGTCWSPSPDTDGTDDLAEYISVPSGTDLLLAESEALEAGDYGHAALVHLYRTDPDAPVWVRREVMATWLDARAKGEA